MTTFSIFRQNFQCLQKLCQPFGVNVGSKKSFDDNAFLLRSDAVDILQQICRLVAQSTLKKSTIVHISEEILNLLKFIGPFHYLSVHVTNAHSPLGNKVS